MRRSRVRLHRLGARGWELDAGVDLGQRQVNAHRLESRHCLDARCRRKHPHPVVTAEKHTTYECGIDPARPDCPEILQAGFLTPGQRGDTGVFTSARTCEYHDHTALGVPAFQGRIVIR